MTQLATPSPTLSPTPSAALGWSRLPAHYAIPATAPTLAEAREYCARLARTHYENFSVASWFLPRRLRQHFFNVYAYCRISDDLGDEVGDPPRRSNFSTSGSTNSTPATEALRNIPCSWPSQKPCASSTFPNTNSPTC